MTTSCTSITSCSFGLVRSENRASQCPALSVGPGNRCLRYARGASQPGHLSGRAGRGQLRRPCLCRLDDERDARRSASAQRAATRPSTPCRAGIVASASAAAISRTGLEPSPSAATNPAVQAMKSATPTASSSADPRAELVVRIPDRLLQSRCDADDPEHEAVVPVPECDEREPSATRRRRVRHRLLDCFLVTKVQPPERTR